MKTFYRFLKNLLIAVIVVGAIPLLMLGMLCRFAHDAVAVGGELYDDVANWLDKK